MKKTDAIVAAVLFIFSLTAVFWLIPAYTEPGEEFGLPPAAVPTVAATVLGLLSLLLLFKSIRGLKKSADQGQYLEKKNTLRTLAYVGIMALGVLLIQYLGYMVGGCVFLAGWMLITGQRNPWIILPVSVITPVLIHSALWYGLNISLP